MTITTALNGNKKSIGVGTLTGILVAGIAFVGMHFTISDRLRLEGATEAALISSVSGLQDRVSRLEAIHEKMDRDREDWLRFMGELPGLRREIGELRQEIRNLQTDFNKREGKISAMEQRWLNDLKVRDQK